MDNQQHQKLAHTQSDHHHGVHICHKCGWPYPNSHPSAKHRRAHKRICGKVEGYKLGDFEGSAHSNVSDDDEHLSDEDHKNPSRQVLGASSHEKGSGGTKEFPCGSKDEAFSDAAAEFLDGGDGGRTQGRAEDAGESATNVEKNLKTESDMAQSVERGPVAASFNSNRMVGAFSDRQTEGLAVLLDGNRNASVDDLHPIKSETLEDASPENQKTNTVDDVVDRSLKLAEQRSNLEGQKETYFDSKEDVVGGSLKSAEQWTNLEGRKETYFDSKGDVVGSLKLAKQQTNLEGQKETYFDSKHDVVRGSLKLAEERTNLEGQKETYFDSNDDVVGGSLKLAEQRTNREGQNETYFDSKEMAGQRTNLEGQKETYFDSSDDVVDSSLKLVEQRTNLEGQKETYSDSKDGVDGSLKSAKQRTNLEGQKETYFDSKHDVVGGSLKLAEQRTNLEGQKETYFDSSNDVVGGSLKLAEQRTNLEGQKETYFDSKEMAGMLSNPEGQKETYFDSNTVDDVVDGSLKLAEQQTKLEGQKETYFDSNLQDIKTPPSKLDGETDEAISKSDETLKVNSESSRPKPDDGNLQLQEEHSDGFHLKTSKSNVSLEVESVELVNALNDMAEKTVEIAGPDFVDFDDVAKKKGGVDANLHSLSVPDDIHEVDNLKIVLQDFKDHEVMKLDQSATLESKQTKDKGDESHGFVFEESSQSNQSEGIVLSSSDKHVLKDSVQLDQGSSGRIVKEVLVEGDADVSQLVVKTTEDQRSNEIGAAVEKTFSVSSTEEQGSHDICRNTLRGNVSRNFDNAVPDADLGIASDHAGTVPETRLVNENSSEKDEKFDLSGDHNNKRAREVDYAENPVTAAEGTGSGFDFQVNPATYLQEGDNAGNSLNIEGEKADATQNDDTDAAARPVKNETGFDRKISSKDSSLEHPVPVVAPGSAKNLSEVKINPEAIVWEGHTARNFYNIETKTDKITGDARDAAAGFMKDESGNDNSNTPSKESCLEQPVLTSVAAKNLAEVEINLETNLRGDTAGNFDEVETKKDKITRDPGDVKDETGVDNDSSPLKDSRSELPAVIPESSKKLVEVEINPESDIREGDTAGNFDEVETKNDEISGDCRDAAALDAKYETGVDNSNRPSKEIFSVDPVSITPESVKNLAEVKINCETNLQEGDSAGKFDKVEAKKEEIIEDACDAASYDAKDVTEIDHGNSISKESCLENRVVFPEAATNIAEVEINSKTNLREGDDAGKFDKVEAKKEEISGDPHDAAARDAKDEFGVDNDNSPSKESRSEYPAVTPGSVKNLAEVEINLETNLQEGVTAGTIDKVEAKKDCITTGACDLKGETGVDNNNSPSKEICLEHHVLAPESAKALLEVGINPVADLQEGDTAGSFDKVETIKDNILGDACDAKDETGVANSDSHSRESRSEHPVVTPESAKILSEVEINLVTGLREGDTAGTFDKVETKKDDITGDAYDDTAGHVKDELGVDNIVDPTKKSLTKHPVVTLESARIVSDLEVNPESNLQEEKTAGNFEKVETKKDDTIADSCDAAADHVKVEIGGDNSFGPTKESGPGNAVVAHEFASQLLELYVNPATNSQEGNDTFDPEKGRTEKLVEHGTEGKDSSVEENLPVQLKTVPESASHPRECQTVAEDVLVRPMEKLQETGCTYVDGAFDSSKLDDDVVRDIQIESVDDKLDENFKVQIELIVNTATQSNCERELRPLLYTVDNHEKETTLSPAVEDNFAREFDAGSGRGSESFQRESDRQQFGDSTHGMSVDSGSQTDSLENNWGSVSVISIQSDAQAVIDVDTVQPIESQPVIGERGNSKESKPASGRQYPDKSDMFEPPSFMTLVESGGENDKKAKADEIQTKSSTVQAGWFPSIAHVVNESQGRKKNEQKIAKVTNWSTGKPHSPLKNLLGEASLETRAKSPKRKDRAPSPQKDDKAASTVSSIPAPEPPLDQAANRETGNEWNSPARYPTEIKREKRKPKGRPYWAQFMCCSSVH
ncbi:hypothetical protein L484_026874 [Morus notabilis]|uniref:C2H2-type domain-containing protein n=1 Tax=Morus notabilis TaxID=981085 RepID=W9RGM6_9ROSA|nr:hypothetical protein L484_026874 [Morus notabilis]